MKKFVIKNDKLLINSINMISEGWRTVLYMDWGSTRIQRPYEGYPITPLNLYSSVDTVILQSEHYNYTILNSLNNVWGAFNKFCETFCTFRRLIHVLFFC